MGIKHLMMGALLSSSVLLATPIIMENGYVKIGVSDDGTFGVGGSTSPGIMFDNNGTGDYGVDDYLIPGTPWEYFCVEFDGNESCNNNAGSPAIPDTTISGDANHVTAVSVIPGKLRLTQDYILAPGSKVVQISAVIENISGAPLGDVKYGRGLDPDVDVIAYGEYNTHNYRGTTLSDGTVVAPEDIVIAEGMNTGKIIAFYVNSPYTHNTAVTNWDMSIDTTLSGLDVGDGDNTIHSAIEFGDIPAGESIAFSLNYVASQDSNDLELVLNSGAVPPPPAAAAVSVPLSAPAKVLLLLLFGLAAGTRFRQKG